MKPIKPEILAEWDYEKNVDQNPHLLSRHSTKKVHWKCANGHTFKTAIVHRSTSCLYCSNKRLWKGFNDLQTKRPDLLQDWNYELNNEIGVFPDDVLFCSSKLVWWTCSVNTEHTWKTNLNHRTSPTPTNCPYCAYKKVLKGFNDLATTHPELLKEWDFQLNTKRPDEIIAKTKTKFFWRCKLNHSYQMSGEKKALHQKCPYCCNKKILLGYNDFLSQQKELSKEWNYELNSKNPQEYYMKSRSKVWWICDNNHSWQATITNRVVKKSNCPECSHKVSKGEKELRAYIQTIYPNNTIIFNERKAILPYELDIYITDKKIAFEFNGDYWHSSKHLKKQHNMTAHEYHIMKKERAERNGILLFFIWQNDWESKNEEIRCAIKTIQTSKSNIPDILSRTVGVQG